MESSLVPGVDYREIYRASLDAYAVLRADPPHFTLLDLSDEYCRITGVRREDVLGRPFFEVFPEDSDPTPDGWGEVRLRASFETVLHAKRTDLIGATRFEPGRTGGGTRERTPRYWSSQNIPFFGDDGEITHILQRLHEITEFFLRERGAHAGHTEPAARIRIYDRDANRRGYLEELLGARWTVESVEDPDRFAAPPSGDGEEFPDLYLWSTDAYTPDMIDEIARPASDPSGNRSPHVPSILIARAADATAARPDLLEAWDDVIAGSVAPREILARVQTQLAVSKLRREVWDYSRAEYHRLFFKAPVGIALLEGPNHVYALSNAANQSLVGERDVLGKPFVESFREDERAPFLEELDRVYASGTPVYREGFPLRLADSEERKYVNYAFLPVHDLDGEIQQIAMFASDVTELVEAKRDTERLAAKVERRSRRKDEFLAALSHELRNPLAPIAAAATILETNGDTPEPETVQWAADMLERQTDQLTRIIDDLLDIARINEGHIELDPAPRRISEIVEQAVETARNTVEERHQELTLHIPDGLVVRGDRTRLVQVVSNLLDNASKYTPDGGHIELLGRREDDDVVLEVRDDGQGIPPDALDEIFEPFTQVRTRAAHGDTSLGFGLSLVRKLVELHGGRIEARSAGEGEGSQFVLRLPAHDEPQDESPPRSNGGPAERAPVRVLLIDDNADVADALGRLLQPMVDALEIAHDGTSGLEAAERFEPTLVFLDIAMPDLDGFEVARRLRGTEHGRRTRLVAMTGYGRRSDRADTASAGFDAHLVKPVTPEDLEEQLGEVAHP